MPDFVPDVEKFDIFALARTYPDLAATLEQTDAQTAAAVAERRCPFCNGPLHVANYLRKPRGGSLFPQCEPEIVRHSLCCGREGCRRRVLPPSVRFLGRKVYVESVVMLACTSVLMVAPLRRAAKILKISARTLGRWRHYWRQHVPDQAWWVHLRSRLRAPAPDETLLPSSLLAHLHIEKSGADLLLLAARCLMGATTTLSFVAFFVGVVNDVGGQR